MGTFITIYGINNIGKTYHAKRLVEKLNESGKKAVYIKYPIYSMEPTGPFLNKILRSDSRQAIGEEELQLWFVLNRCQFEPELKRLLREGFIVIAEDYVGTGIAWGAAKSENSAKAMEEFEVMNKYLVQEDAAIMLDGRRSLKSKEKSHIHESDDALSEKCQKIYRVLADKYGWKVVEVDADKEVTAGRVWDAVESLLR